LISLLAITLFAVRVEAESVCVSYFAAQGFTSSQVREALKVFRHVKRPCVSVLWNTFDIRGRKTFIKRFLKKFKDKPHVLQIHFDNGSARRSGTAEPYDIGFGWDSYWYNFALKHEFSTAIEPAQARTHKIVDYVSRYGNANTQVIFSRTLEDDYTSKAYQVLARAQDEILPPTFLTSRNPNGKPEYSVDYSRDDLIELHGFKPKWAEASRSRCIASTDGYSIDFDGSDKRGVSQGVLSLSDLRDFIRRHQKRGCYVFVFWPEPQGRGIGLQFIEPRRRDFRIHSKDVHIVNKIIRRFEK
jgi:hypothetical protein